MSETQASVATRKPRWSVLVLTVTLLIEAATGCKSHHSTIGPAALPPRAAEVPAEAEVPRLETPTGPSASVGHVRVRFVTIDEEEDGPPFQPSEALVAALVGSPAPAAPPPGLDIGGVRQQAFRDYPIPQAAYESIEDQVTGSFGGPAYDECESLSTCRVHAAVVEDALTGHVREVVDLGAACGGMVGNDISASIEAHTLEAGESVFVIRWDDTVDMRGPCGCAPEIRRAHLVVLDRLGRPVIREEVDFTSSECSSSDEYHVSWRDVDGDGKPELVGEVSRSAEDTYDAYAAGATGEPLDGEEEDVEGEDVEPAREPWFIHHFDDAATATRRAPLADHRCVPAPPPSPPVVAPAPPSPPARVTAAEARRSRSAARQALHANLAACEFEHPASCFEAASQLRALQREAWAEVVERAAISAVQMACRDDDGCVDLLSPGSFAPAAYPHVRTALARDCPSSPQLCLAVAEFDLASGTNVEAAEALLLAFCEGGPRFAACRQLAGRSPDVWQRTARVLCRDLDARACVESAREARSESRPLTLLELFFSPACP